MFLACLAAPARSGTRCRARRRPSPAARRGRNAGL